MDNYPQQRIGHHLVQMLYTDSDNDMSRRCRDPSLAKKCNKINKYTYKRKKRKEKEIKANSYDTSFKVDRSSCANKLYLICANKINGIKWFISRFFTVYASRPLHSKCISDV